MCMYDICMFMYEFTHLFIPVKTRDRCQAMFLYLICKIGPLSELELMELESPSRLDGQ